MSIAFTTAGRIAFRVKIIPTTVNLGRLATAVFKTEARVSHVERPTPREWSAVVWLRPFRVPAFEHICKPISFEFISTRDVIRNPRESDD